MHLLTNKKNKMKLDENYSLEMDARNFTLKYKNVYFDEKKKKDVTSIDEWHFSSLKGAINKYMNESFKPCKSIIEFSKELNRVELLISKIK